MKEVTDMFSVKIEFEDGTEVAVPLDFDFSDLTTAEVDQATELTDSAETGVASLMYVRLLRDVPELDFEMFNEAMSAVLAGDDSFMELVE